MSAYTISSVPDKGSLITFSPGDIHELLKDADKNALLDLARKEARTVIDLSKTRRIGTQWLAWFGRMTVEAEAGGNLVRVVGAEDTTKKTADLIAAQLHYATTIEEGWGA